jgi:hypothetical protein
MIWLGAWPGFSGRKHPRASLPGQFHTLPDGSWLARMVPTPGTDRAKATPLTARVIDYTRSTIDATVSKSTGS